jgi:hypothetical protein
MSLIQITRPLANAKLRLSYIILGIAAFLMPTVAGRRQCISALSYSHLLNAAAESWLTALGRSQ